MSPSTDKRIVSDTHILSSAVRDLGATSGVSSGFENLLRLLRGSLTDGERNLPVVLLCKIGPHALWVIITLLSSVLSLLTVVGGATIKIKKYGIIKHNDHI